MIVSGALFIRVAAYIPNLSSNDVSRLIIVPVKFIISNVLVTVPVNVPIPAITHVAVPIPVLFEYVHVKSVPYTRGFPYELIIVGTGVYETDPSAITVVGNSMSNFEISFSSTINASICEDIVFQFAAFT